MKKSIYYCFLAFTAIAISACSSEDGEMGPAGPQGSAGPQGETGTANVLYSDWINIEWNGADESEYKRMNIVEASITTEFMDSGTLLMYLKYDNGSVTALPYTDRFGQVFSFFMFPENFPGVGYPGSFPNEAGTGFFIQRVGGVASGGFGSVRYVLIPGGTPMENALINEEIDITNYNDVTSFLGIEKY